MKRSNYLLSALALGGWFFGAVSAAGTNCWLLPRLLTYFGGSRTVPLLAGLVIGAILIWFWVELTRHWAERVETRAFRSDLVRPIQRSKSAAEQLPLLSRLIIGLVALLIVGGMIMSVAPPPAYHLR